MALESVALIPRCAECEARWLPTDEERWLAYLGGDDLDDPGEVFYRPDCANKSSGSPVRVASGARGRRRSKLLEPANLKRRV